MKIEDQSRLDREAAAEAYYRDIQEISAVSNYQRRFDVQEVFLAGWDAARTGQAAEVAELIECIEMFRGYCTEEFAPYPMKHSAELLYKFHTILKESER